MQIPGWGLQETSEERDPTGMKGRRASQGFYPLPGIAERLRRNLQKHNIPGKFKPTDTQRGTGTPKGEETSKAALSVTGGAQSSTKQPLHEWRVQARGARGVHVTVEEPSLNRDGVRRHFPTPTGNTVPHQRWRVPAGSCGRFISVLTVHRDDAFRLHQGQLCMTMIWINENLHKSFSPWIMGYTERTAQGTRIIC